MFSPIRATRQPSFSSFCFGSLGKFLSFFIFFLYFFCCLSKQNAYGSGTNVSRSLRSVDLSHQDDTVLLLLHMKQKMGVGLFVAVVVATF